MVACKSEATQMFLFSFFLRSRCFIFNIWLVAINNIDSIRHFKIKFFNLSFLSSILIRSAVYGLFSLLFNKNSSFMLSQSWVYFQHEITIVVACISRHTRKRRNRKCLILRRFAFKWHNDGMTDDSIATSGIFSSRHWQRLLLLRCHILYLWRIRVCVAAVEIIKAEHKTTLKKLRIQCDGYSVFAFIAVSTIFVLSLISPRIEPHKCCTKSMLFFFTLFYYYFISFA